MSSVDMPLTIKTTERIELEMRKLNRGGEMEVK